MWFFRSFTYLHPPGSQWVTRILLFLALYLLFDGAQGRWLGIEVFGLKIAVFFHALLIVVHRLPVTLDRMRAAELPAVAPIAVAVAPVFLAILFAPSLWHLQVYHLFGLCFFAGFITILMFASDDEFLNGIPDVWAPNARLVRRSFWLRAIQSALLALIGSWVIASGSELDWVVFFLLAPTMLFYVRQWLMVLTVMTDPDGEP
ncbi:hypothetical protein AIOL_003527 [Candidatus Rhodobacter oscarellae]|uniref:Uncharacterized protein n=1 Tax=Candidatus Rhodobacter oscarellae TaxID=1675527 RepID=A0A0J9E705_9RHOB|nr:hypothetical protein [Candidatus Rhodobacter lobularis]KMW58550.1 hypothetical protein AIOL_003527 [Candidatus Rhodobacter lobularis]